MNFTECEIRGLFDNLREVIKNTNETFVGVILEEIGDIIRICEPSDESNSQLLQYQSLLEQVKITKDRLKLKDGRRASQQQQMGERQGMDERRGMDETAMETTNGPSNIIKRQPAQGGEKVERSLPVERVNRKRFVPARWHNVVQQPVASRNNKQPTKYIKKRSSGNIPAQEPNLNEGTKNTSTRSPEHTNEEPRVVVQRVVPPVEIPPVLEIQPEEIPDVITIESEGEEHLVRDNEEEYVYMGDDAMWDEEEPVQEILPDQWSGTEDIFEHGQQTNVGQDEIIQNDDVNPEQTSSQEHDVIVQNYDVNLEQAASQEHDVIVQNYDVNLEQAASQEDDVIVQNYDVNLQQTSSQQVDVIVQNYDVNLQQTSSQEDDVIVQNDDANLQQDSSQEDDVIIQNYDFNLQQAASQEDDVIMQNYDVDPEQDSSQEYDVIMHNYDVNVREPLMGTEEQDSPNSRKVLELRTHVTGHINRTFTHVDCSEGGQRTEALPAFVRFLRTCCDDHYPDLGATIPSPPPCLDAASPAERLMKQMCFMEKLRCQTLNKLQLATGALIEQYSQQDGSLVDVFSCFREEIWEKRRRLLQACGCNVCLTGSQRPLPPPSTGVVPSHFHCCQTDMSIYALCHSYPQYSIWSMQHLLRLWKATQASMSPFRLCTLPSSEFNLMFSSGLPRQLTEAISLGDVQTLPVFQTNTDDWEYREYRTTSLYFTDGDSFKLDRVEEIRVFGIDAPELWTGIKVWSGKTLEFERPVGIDAFKYVWRLHGQSTSVRLQFKPNHEGNRRVAIVWLYIDGEWQDYALLALQRGLVFPYVHFNVKAEYVEAFQQAKQQKEGMFRMREQVIKHTLPWDLRKQRRDPNKQLQKTNLNNAISYKVEIVLKEKCNQGRNDRQKPYCCVSCLFKRMQSLKVAPSPIAGEGLFARNDIKKGKIICVYDDFTSNSETINGDYRLDVVGGGKVDVFDGFSVKHYQYGPMANDDVFQYFIGNLKNHVNNENKVLLLDLFTDTHCRKGPNAKVELNKKSLVLKATRRIMPDEEICISYGLRSFWFPKLHQILERTLVDLPLQQLLEKAVELEPEIKRKLNEC